MEEKTVQRSFFQRLFGRPATSGPADTTCWVYAGGRVVIDLSRAAELQQPGGAFRLESDTLPTRLLIVHGEDGVYRAFRNRCTHMGRRLDPVPGTNRVQCCSIGKTTYGPDGEVIRGSGKEPLTVLPVRAENGSLIVDLSGIDP